MMRSTFLVGEVLDHKVLENATFEIDPDPVGLEYFNLAEDEEIWSSVVLVVPSLLLKDLGGGTFRVIQVLDYIDGR